METQKLKKNPPQTPPRWRWIEAFVSREFDSEAPVSEKNVRPYRMQQRTVQFSDVPWKWWW